MAFKIFNSAGELPPGKTEKMNAAVKQNAFNIGRCIGTGGAKTIGDFTAILIYSSQTHRGCGEFCFRVKQRAEN